MITRASQSVWSRFSGFKFSLRGLSLQSFSLLAITATALAQNPPANPVPAVGTSGRVSLGIGTVEVIPALKVTLATRGAEQAIELDRVQQSLDGQLTAAFGATGKFDVIARSDWPQILREQDFTTGGNVNGMDPQAAKSFMLKGIRWIVIPQIADFQDYIETGVFEGLGQKLTRRIVKLALVTKIYDTTTGRLIESVNSKYDDQKIINDPTNSTVQGGRFTDSMILDIARLTGEQVANDIVDRLMPAKILAITDRVATISRGAGAGVATGQVWQVFALGQALTDPDTGESLGAEEVPVGWMQIQTADARVSRGGLCGDDFGVATGCIVRKSTKTACPTSASPGAVRDVSTPSQGTPAAGAVPAASGAVNGTAGGAASVQAIPQRYSAAIFVKNRPADVSPEKVMVLEDYIAAQVDKFCFTTVSREDTLNAVARFATSGANVGTNIDPAKDLDRILSDETSALRLAQQMGVDYILIASITAYINDRQQTEAYGATTDIRSAQLDVTYRLLGRVQGQVITSDSVTATEKVRQSPNLKQERDLIDVVIRRCAQEIGESVGKRCSEATVTAPSTLPTEVPFRIVCTMQDMTIPGVVTDAATGRYVVSGVNWNLLPTNAAVEIDGLVVGNAPEMLNVFPGLHKVSITCEGFRPWNRTINVRPGMSLSVPLQLTDEGLIRWRSQLAFMQSLTERQQLVDAEVDRIRAAAEYIRNSRMVLDIQDSTKINTNQAPTYVIPNWWPSGSFGNQPGGNGILPQQPQVPVPAVP
ncbi:MAG: PEGA domain-containing protein [Planctomycetes bacterium]|nr:PEGA domain-containing protein [Planctomycetota bacterium]